MIFIKNKKAWKEFVRENEADKFPDEQPKQYPCFTRIIGSIGGRHYWAYCYREGLESMIDKIDSGREF